MNRIRARSVVSVYLYMLCRLMYWRMLLIYIKQLLVSGLWVHNVFFQNYTDKQKDCRLQPLTATASCNRPPPSTQLIYRLIQCSYFNRKPAQVSRYRCLYTVSQKNDTDVTHYRFNPHQLISVTFYQRCCWESMLLNGDLLSHLS